MVAVLMVAGVGLVAPGAVHTSATCAGPQVLDFAGIPKGTILGEQYAASGIHMSAIANEGRPNHIIVFDSNASDTRDPALQAGIGNLAIIPEHIIDADGDGLVDDPNDSIRGGAHMFEFDTERAVAAFTIVDSDHGTPSTHFAAAYDAANNLIKRVPIAIGANGNVQTVSVEASGVRRLEIVTRDSAGVTNIEIDCSQAAPPSPEEPPPPEPTSAPTSTVRTSTAPILSAPRPTYVPPPRPAPLRPLNPVAARVLPATGDDPDEGSDSWPTILVLGTGLALLVGEASFSKSRS